MKNYDFETIIDRSGTNSAKWNSMLSDNPNLPKGIVPLSVADMELKTAPEIVEGLKDYLDNAILGYGGASQAYLDAVCSFMKRRHNWEVSSEWIVNCPGVVAAFFEAVKAYTTPGEGVIIMSPVYYPFSMAVTQSKRTLVSTSLINNGGRYEIDWEDFESKASETNNKVLLFCSPHNPVGRVWTGEELTRVAEICIKNNILILSDEIHFDLILPGHNHTVMATLSEEVSQNCVIFTAPSKTFNLAGLQASNIIIPNPELRKKFKVQLSSSSIRGLNLLGYEACRLAYTECDEWLDQLIIHLDKNREFAEDYISKNIPPLKVCPLEGTYLQWWDCRNLNMEHLELERFMKEKALLYLDEGYIFGDEGRGYERINIACPTAVLKNALDRLRTALL